MVKTKPAVKKLKKKSPPTHPVGGVKIKIVKKAKISKKTVKPSGKKTKEKMNQIWEDLLLKDPRIRKWLVQMIGEHSIHVIKEFSHELSDEDIAKKSDLRASDVRVVLNRLHSHGLANYSRNRDKNSGWYSYMWRLDNAHAQELYEAVQKMSQEREESLLREGMEYYFCPDEGKNALISFDVASEKGFRCANCGKMLEYFEKKK
ncbi:MAG: hypothetical protein WC492_00105 [Candidatus Micrarchaeia archaeon]